MRKFGLIGYPLGHSFSGKYFTEKFEKEEIRDVVYELFPIEKIEAFPALVQANPDLIGLNVTIPYKESIIQYLDEMDPKAKAIGAVNTLLLDKGRIKGFNTDYYGFKESLEKWLAGRKRPEKALVLGTGGASKAVQKVLEDIGMDFQLVSRNEGAGLITYEMLKADLTLFRSSELIINTSPLGMHPETHTFPDLPYDQLTSSHHLFDLVYNPLITAFMQKGIDKQCWVKNGLEMLHLQAEKAWELWN